MYSMNECLYKLDVGDPRIAIVRERRDQMQQISRDFARSTSARESQRIGLTKEQLQLLLTIIDPVSKANPFQTNLRFRNWILVLVLVTFGFRRGETLKLYVSDVEVNGRRPKITICRRPGDPKDSRANEPAVKTLGRELDLCPRFAKILTDFICHHRPMYPNAQYSPYLFFSRKGRPLSIRSVNAILEQVVRRNPEFATFLTPHVLRYTFNDMFDARMHASGLSNDERKSVRNYVNGWSQNSEQGALYAKREIQDRANIINLEHQRSLFV